MIRRADELTPATGRKFSGIAGGARRRRLSHAMAKTDPAKPKSKPKLATKAKPETSTKARGKRQEGGLRNAWSQNDWLLLANAVGKRLKVGKSGRLAKGSWSAIAKEVNAKADVTREGKIMCEKWSNEGNMIVRSN